MEEIFRLKAEVSRLMYERASLTEEKAELQRTLLDQETSFSYTLRCCQSEMTERDQLIGRLEAQVREGEKETVLLYNYSVWSNFVIWQVEQTTLAV